MARDQPALPSPDHPFLFPAPLAAIAVILLASIVPATGLGQVPVPIGLRKQLMVDDYVIANNSQLFLAIGGRT
jgi:hypothetical protein